MSERLPITEEWLKSVGFKWSQIERQPVKNWILFLGDGITDPRTGERPWGVSYDDMAIQLAGDAYDEVTKDHSAWFCWLRCDTSHAYHRFMHIRHLLYQDEVVTLVTALTGKPWNPEHHWYGGVVTARMAESLKQEHERLDKQIHRQQHPWYEQEKDPTRAGPLAEDKEAAIKSGLVK